MPRARVAQALPLALLLGLVAAPGVARAEPVEADAEPTDAEATDAEPEGSEAESEGATGPKWISHTVVPKETYESIGARYGVSREEIIRWNKKKLGAKQWIYAGKTLRIHARIHAPPREKITYTIAKHDTWAKIAARFGVPASHVKAWNPKVKGLIAGKPLKIYTDPKAPPPSASGGGSGSGTGGGAVPKFHVRAGGIGVGAPNRGTLVNGVQLPESDMVKILDKDKVWGTSHTIEHLQEAIAVFRRSSGYDQPLVISSISLRHGGRFRPHSSHRTGRDVDIRLPRKPGADKGDAPSSIDWTKTWALVRALVDTGEVEYIFVSWSRQKYLYRAAQSAGATKAELAKIVQYPTKPKERTKAVVRHAQGHTMHLHVRFTCTPGNSRCKSY
ncbi:MAG: penicillin-insensitive murein endopeptidase [Myxococcales bacterium]|nr:penicillin-insensitive murein endopeptidase [Myxococcales bacterium]